MKQAAVVALLGAESTGKTVLADALVEALRARGRQAVRVPELLRAWCEREGRVPRPDEQQAIAQAQQATIDAAAESGVKVVVADTTPLMTAIYSELLFGDRSLHPFALHHLRRCAQVLLTGLDLPWVADGIQRDGPHVRAPVDAALRCAMESAGIGFQVVYGRGEQRLTAALNAIESIAVDVKQTGATAGFDEKKTEHSPATRWSCAHCGDAACERRLFDCLRGSRG